MEPTKQEEVLLDLWRWKMLPMAAIHQMHFPRSSAMVAYRQVRKLQKLGLVRVRGDSLGQRFVYCLTKKGFKQVQATWIGSLREEGFESEHFEHDLLTTAVNLGDWMHGVPSTSDLYSEQELRRNHLENYDEWVPRSLLHRPDGYWHFNIPNGETFTVALEVELNLKRERDYQICGWYYEDTPNIDRVVWVVRTFATMKTLWRCITEKRRKNFIPHNILMLSDFLEKGWMATFLLGPDKGKSLNWLLHGGEEKSVKTFSTSYLLDNRKSGMLAGPCKRPKFSRKVY